MTLMQMHERLRLELLRRIQRGTLSVSLLARQTGFAQAHLSNFLHAKRRLSLEGMNRILLAQHLTAIDLLPAPVRAVDRPLDRDDSRVPIVSHATALFEPILSSSAVQSVFYVPASVLENCRPKGASQRRGWERFVAVRISAVEALSMEPLLLPDAIVLIDRYYTSLRPYQPLRPNLYAVRQGVHLVLRYANFLADRLVLRPHSNTRPVEVIEIAAGESLDNLIIGRVALIQNVL